jgi:hypothetical protein
MKSYAGIGSRETPQDILLLMQDLAVYLAGEGYTLRSGGAGGADTAFERGCDGAGGPKQIFLPWNGFSGRYATSSFGTDTHGVFAGVGPQALALAEQFHPAWKRCSRGARTLHARNGYQVLGPRLDDPVEFVLCWTPRGSGSGGTGQALRIARDRGIRVYDLAVDQFDY